MNNSFPEWQHKVAIVAHDANGMRGTIIAGLHYLKGNKSPYFSVTCNFSRHGLGSYGGACHDEILKIIPALAPVVALHLSSMDGMPMHALANAQYHAGLCKGAEDGKNLVYLARHLRCDAATAEQLANGDLAGLVSYVAAQKERWQAEAQYAIATLNFLAQTENY